MVYLRTTTASAMPTAIQVADEMKKWIGNAGGLAPAMDMLASLQNLHMYSRESAFDVEVILAAGADLVQFDILNSWLGNALESHNLDRLAREPIHYETPSHEEQIPVNLTISTPDTAPIRKVGVPVPPVLALILSDAAQWEIVSHLIKERGIIFVIGHHPEAYPLQFKEYAWETLSYDWEMVEASTLQQILSSSPYCDAKELLQTFAVANSLSKLSEVLSLAVDQEVKGTKIKRAMIQQKAAKMQQQGMVNSNEFFSELRSYIQHQLYDFERGAANRMNDLFAPQTGTLFVEIKNRINGLDTLEKISMAKTTQLSIPGSFSQALLKVIFEKVIAHCRNDLLTMKDFFKLISQGVEDKIMKSKGPPVVPQFQFISVEQVEKLLDGKILLERMFKGELPRKGFYEYLMAARRYQMVAFMLLSAFGLSFLRRYREYMIPLTIVLLSVGGISIFHSVRRERTEGLAKEIEKAKDLLQAELTRIFNDIQRGWSTLISNHLKEQSVALMSQIESSTRHHYRHQIDIETEEKQRVQRQLHGLDTQERTLLGVKKARDAFNNTLVQLIGDLPQLYRNLDFQPAERRASI